MIGWGLGATLTGATIAAAAVGRGALRIRRRARLTAVARSVTLRHARLLGVKRKQLVKHDGYGNYELQPWIDHVDYFIGQVILRESVAQRLDVSGIEKGTRTWSDLTRTLLATLQAQEGREAPIETADVISGEHYEVLCRNLLQARGWHVEATPMSGDQGADLIADADACRVVIQCKFHARPIGNKAVQEAQAAIRLYAGSHAAVVSNASFTRSARELASANGVLLLHHDELADLGRLIRQAEAEA